MDVLVELAGERPDLIDPHALSEAITDLIARVSLTRAQAAEGRIQMGSRSAHVMLAQALALTPTGDREAVELLLGLAQDTESPSEHMFEAREALVILKAAGLLDEDDRQRIRAMSDTPGTLPSHGEFTSALLAAQRRRALAPDLTAEQRTRLAVDTRDPDGRVRHIAILTAASVLSAGPDQTIGWALLSGLFDPQDEVLQATLAAVARGALDGLPDARTVACERVARLYDDTQSSIREAVLYTAAHLASDSGRLRRLIADAASDPSWRVRRAAADAVRNIKQ
jgi:HEAT repeat protein